MKLIFSVFNCICIVYTGMETVIFYLFTFNQNYVYISDASSFSERIESTV